MQCSTCGSIIPDGSRFCRECGASLTVPTQASAQTPEATPLGQAQPMAPLPTSPAASYNSMGASVPAEAAPKKNNGALIAAAVALIVALLALGAVIAWKLGLIGNTAVESAHESEPIPIEHVLGKTKVFFNVNADYYEEGGSNLPIRVAGTTTAGETVNITVFISPITGEAEPVELEDGTYTYEAQGSPISSNGVIYDYGDIQGSFTVDASGEADLAAETNIEATLAPIDPLVATDEQIEDAYEWAKKDEECDNAEELKATAETLRDDAIQKDAQEKAEAERKAAINALADAYETILDNSAANFVDNNSFRNGEYWYYLFDMSGDGVPELLLWQENGGGELGGTDVYVYVYDSGLGQVTRAITEDGYDSLYMYIRRSLFLDESSHSIIDVQSDLFWDSEFYRVWLEGSQLKSEYMKSAHYSPLGTGDDEAVAGLDNLNFNDVGALVSDRSLIDQMREL